MFSAHMYIVTAPLYFRLSLSGDCKSRDKICWRWKKFSNPGTVDLWNDNRSNNGTSLGTTTLWPTQVFHKCDCSDQNLSRRLQASGSQSTSSTRYVWELLYFLSKHTNCIPWKHPGSHSQDHYPQKWTIPHTWEQVGGVVVEILRVKFHFQFDTFQTVSWQLINKMFSRLLLVENSLDDNDKQ